GARLRPCLLVLACVPPSREVGRTVARSFAGSYPKNSKNALLGGSRRAAAAAASGSLMSAARVPSWEVGHFIGGAEWPCDDVPDVVEREVGRPARKSSSVFTTSAAESRHCPPARRGAVIGWISLRSAARVSRSRCHGPVESHPRLPRLPPGPLGAPAT